MNELVAAALRYAAQGWAVFPCQPRGKRPRTSHGLRDATTDCGLIESWWATWPQANVAIRTGRASGIVVLDVDSDDGWESLRALEREHGQLPRTRSVVTPHDGEHFYFAHPGVDVSTRVGQLGDGLDVRGDGGYVVAPPSVGPNGRPYEPDECCALAGLPAWLLERAAPGRGKSRAEPAPPSEWLTMLSHGLPEGRRNDGLTRLAGHLLRRLHVDVAVGLLHLVNEHCSRPPLPRGEVDRLLDSIAARELRRRQGAPR